MRTAEFMADSRFAFLVQVLFGSSPIRFVFIVRLLFEWNLDGDARASFRPVSQMERDAVELDDLPGHGEARARCPARPV